MVPEIQKLTQDNAGHIWHSNSDYLFQILMMENLQQHVCYRAGNG